MINKKEDIQDTGNNCWNNLDIIPCFVLSFGILSAVVYGI